MDTSNFVDKVYELVGDEFEVRSQYENNENKILCITSNVVENFISDLLILKDVNVVLYVMGSLRKRPNNLKNK